MFEFKYDDSFIIEDTTNPGQLQTASDSGALHSVGQVYRNRGDDMTYVYAYNAATTTADTDTVYLLVPKYSTSGVHWQFIAIADDTLKKQKYACVPMGAIPTTYYGWVKVQGTAEIATDAFVTNEAWALNDELLINSTVIATQADTSLGVPTTTFAFAQSSHASDHTASTDTADIYIIGREFQATS